MKDWFFEKHIEKRKVIKSDCIGIFYKVIYSFG